MKDRSQILFYGGPWQERARISPAEHRFEDGAVPLLSNSEYRVIAFGKNGDSLPSRRGILNAVVRDDARVVLNLPKSDQGIAYGQAIDASENALIVGAPKDDDAGEQSGSVYIYDRMPGSAWQYRQKLIGSDSEAYDSFGYSLSIDGRFGSDVAVGGNRVAAVGLQDGEAETLASIFRENDLGGWQDWSLAFGKNAVSIVGRSVALSEGVASVGNAGAGELQSLYEIPSRLLSLVVELGQLGARLFWRNPDAGGFRYAIERRLAETGEWEILGVLESGETSFLDRTAIGNRRWEYRVSSVSGGVSVVSDSVVTSLVTASRLVNLSARGFVGVGQRILISGFAISGMGELELAVRARGPFLLDFGIENPITDPRMTLIDGGGLAIASNDDRFE